MHPLPEHLIQSYRETEYRVRLSTGRWAIIHVGQPLPVGIYKQLPNPRAPWGFITAWNPESEILPVVVNRARQRALINRIKQAAPDAWLRPGAGVGSVNDNGCRWQEPSLFVAGTAHAFLIDLMRQFGQNAIVAAVGNAPAHLVWRDDSHSVIPPP